MAVVSYHVKAKVWDDDTHDYGDAHLVFRVDDVDGSVVSVFQKEDYFEK